MKITDKPSALPTLVEYGCGCVGFPCNQDGWALLLSWCDGSGDHEPGLGMRCMSDRGTSIDPRRAAKLFERMARLIDGGYKLEDLKGLLK